MHDKFAFFFNDTATTEVYTLSLHDALPICRGGRRGRRDHGHRYTHLQRVSRHAGDRGGDRGGTPAVGGCNGDRSEEHTSELQSRENLVCRLLLEKKKKKIITSSKIEGHRHP